MTFSQPDGKLVIPIPPGVLKRPDDADHYRVKVGRWGDRWYTDPLPACDIAPATDAVWPSVTTTKKAGGGDWTFTAIKRIAQALATDPKCLDGLDFYECKDKLSSINKVDLGRAQRRGTNVHTYFEMGLRGHGIKHISSPDEEGGQYLSAVQSFFDTYQPELIAAEVVCIHRDLNGVGYGGTADGVIRIEGKNYWVDYKSRGEDSDHAAYPEEAGQVGAGARAQYMLVEGPNGAIRQRMPDLDGGLVISVKPDGVRLYPIDLDKAFAYWTDLHAFWVAKREEKASIGKPWAPRAAGGFPATEADLLLSLIQAAPSSDELTVLWKQHQDLWTPAHTDAAKARKSALTVAA
jgi:hypothetical protein